MRGKSRPIWLAIALVAILVAGCQQQLNFPKPSLQSINPTNMLAGQPAFDLTVTGGNFTPSSQVLWNGSPRVTIFDSTTSLTAQVLASDVQNAGSAQIQVFSPSPGGGTTTALTFTINPGTSPVPQINSLSPSSTFAGGGAFALTVNGTNFVSLATVTVNGSPRVTTFVNSATLVATILASDIATTGTLQVAVTNPQPSGGSSNSVSFSIKNAVPSLTALSPAAFVAGSAGSLLIVTGTNFVPNSVININGAARATSFVSSTQVSALLTSGDVAAGGIFSVDVTNPAPGGGDSNALTFAVNPTPIIGLPIILDLAPDGTQANDGVCGASCSGTPTLTTAGPSTNDNGQFVAFASDSSNLVANQTSGLSNIFLRNTCLITSITGTTSTNCTPKTTLVSVTPAATNANGPSWQPTIDGAGAHVAYTSTATNLVDYVAVPSGPRQVYWQNTCSSTTTTTSCTGASAAAALVSVSADGLSAGNGDSYDAVISPDGVYVAFISTATNLVSNVLVNGVTPQVYVRNTCSLVPPATSSCTPTTYLVSTPDVDGTTPANAASLNLAISNTGLFVAFTSTATNLGATASNPSGASEVFVRSTCVTTISQTNNTCVPQTILASTPDGTTPANGASTEPSISSDGRFVAFASTATTLIVGVGPTQEIYVRDTCEGTSTITSGCTPSTELISTPDGTTPANGLSESPSVNASCTAAISTVPCATGQYIAFASVASNLGANVENGIENIFSRDTCNGVASDVIGTTTLCAPYTFLSSQPGGSSPAPANGSSVSPSISGNGTAISFISSASNLVAHDNNAIADVFLGPADLAFDLTVTLQGTGSGTVTDSSGQISCVQTAATATTSLTESGTCVAHYASGTNVSLTATAQTGFSFTGWGGSATSVTNATCTVTTGSTTAGTCTFGEITDNTVTATFK